MKKHTKLANDICALVYSATTNTGLIRDPETYVLRPVLEDSKPIRKLLKLLGRLRAAQLADHGQIERLNALVKKQAYDNREQHAEIDRMRETQSEDTRVQKLAEDNRALQKEIDRMRKVEKTCTTETQQENERLRHEVYQLQGTLKSRTKDQRATIYELRQELKEKSQVIGALLERIDQAHAALTVPRLGWYDVETAAGLSKALKILAGAKEWFTARQKYPVTPIVSGDIPPAPEGPGPRDIKGSEVE